MSVTIPAKKLCLGVHIIDGYHMTADAHQYILAKRVTRRKKHEQTTYDDLEPIGYFTTVQFLLKKVIALCVREKIASGEIATLRQVAQEIAAHTERLEQAVLF